MSLNISQVHDRINFLIKKSKWGYVSPQDIDVCLDMAQMSLYDFYYGNTNQYQPGRPIPPVANGQTQKIHDALSPFLKSFTLNGTNGFTTLPSDYLNFDSAYILDQNVTPEAYYPLKVVSNDKTAFRMNSQLMPARDTTDLSNAFISFTPNLSGTNGIQLYPRFATLPSGYTPLAFYLSRPPSPLYSYTQVGRVITYVPATSVDLLWKDDDIVKRIIPKTLEYIGINLEDDRLFQQGQLKDKE